jgi:hypothetical protein
VGGGFQFGLGLAAGVFLFLVIIAILVGTAVALAFGLVRAPWDAPPRVGSVYEGVGSRDSADFRLAGNYDVEWRVTPLVADCTFRIELRSPNRPNLAELLAVGTGITQESTGSRPLSAVPEDAYFVSVDGSNCGWRVRLLPLE